MSIKFPAVPKALGVPDVLRNPAVRVPTVVLLAKDGVAALIGSSSQWGIYKDGKAVLAFDSFVAMDFRAESHISDYPIERGNFESYNKVALPNEYRLTISKAGSDSDRSQFLSSLALIAKSLDLYSIATPDAAYAGTNITRYDFRRAAQNGVSLLVVDLNFQEIRQTASSAFVKATEPSGQAQVDDGFVQTPPVPATVPAPTTTYDVGAKNSGTVSW